MSILRQNFSELLFFWQDNVAFRAELYFATFAQLLIRPELKLGWCVKYYLQIRLI